MLTIPSHLLQPLLWCFYASSLRELSYAHLRWHILCAATHRTGIARVVALLQNLNQNSVWEGVGAAVKLDQNILVFMMLFILGALDSPRWSRRWGEWGTLCDVFNDAVIYVETMVVVHHATRIRNVVLHRRASYASRSFVSSVGLKPKPR